MKFKEIEKMSKQEREKKLKELKVELVKSKSTASKTGKTKTGEIKKIIARIFTFDTLDKRKELKKT